MKQLDEISKLKEWYFRDLQKPSIDIFERAAIIRSYMKDNGLSIRSFSTKLGLKRSTVEDWLLYNRISEKEYNKLIGEGVKPIQIYKRLRTSKKDDSPLTYIDMFLEEIKRKARIYRREEETLEQTPRTKVLLQEAVNELNQLHMTINMIERRGKSGSNN